MPALSQSVSLDRRGRVAVLTVNNPPVNALSQHVRQGQVVAYSGSTGESTGPQETGVESARDHQVPHPEPRCGAAAIRLRKQWQEGNELPNQQLFTGDHSGKRRLERTG